VSERVDLYPTHSAVGTPPLQQPGGQQGKVTIELDGRQVEAQAGSWIIEAADAAGVYIPRFCYHPRMKPVGMCRMCLVEVEGPRGATLMPACYNQVSDGMVVRTSSPAAKKAQEGVLEFLLVNHPLDCPVCDKGGECPLQDQTLAYGPGESRFVEEKRHWEKPIPISELVYLDRERCIQCGRCVRFADEVAGDPLIDFAERGDRTEVATFPGHPYSSYFSGNVVQICPVGALTARTYRFKARPWDLEQAESTCTTCAFGCRVAAQTSAGEVTRLIGVDSDPVNWGWLCDKGRWAIPSGPAPDRLEVPLVRRGEELVEASWPEALSVAAAGLAAAVEAGGGDFVAVLGGARLTNEDAYAWSKLARAVLHTDNVDCQMGDGLPARLVAGLPRATIDQTAAAPLVISLAGDIKSELPVLYLRLRHSLVEGNTSLVELAPAAGGLTPYASHVALYRPGTLVELAEALTASEDPIQDVAGVARSTLLEIRAAIKAAVAAAGEGPKVVVVLGRPSLAEPQSHASAAALALAALPGVAFLPALRRANVMGALDMGLAPGLLPGRVALEAAREWFEHHWGGLPERAGLDAAEVLAASARAGLGALVLVGADPLVDLPDSRTALKGLLGAHFVISVSTTLNASARKADVVLPACAWGERRGTTTNVEGRITRLAQVVAQQGSSWPDWVIASELAASLGADLGFGSLEQIWDEIEKVSALHRGVRSLLAGPGGSDGVLVPVWSHKAAQRSRPLDPMADPGIASAEVHKLPPAALATAAPLPLSGVSPEAGEGLSDPPRISTSDLASYATVRAKPAADGLRLVVRRTLWDAGSLVQGRPLLASLAPDPSARVHPSVLAEVGVAEGEKVRLASSTGTLVMPVGADPGLPEGSV